MQFPSSPHPTLGLLHTLTISRVLWCRRRSRILHSKRMLKTSMTLSFYSTLLFQYSHLLLNSICLAEFFKSARSLASLPKIFEGAELAIVRAILKQHQRVDPARVEARELQLGSVFCLLSFLQNNNNNTTIEGQVNMNCELHDFTNIIIARGAMTQWDELWSWWYTNTQSA